MPTFLIIAVLLSIFALGVLYLIVIYNRLVTHEIAQATSLAFTITEAIRTEIGGVQQYIPRGLSRSRPATAFVKRLPQLRHTACSFAAE